MKHTFSPKGVCSMKIDFELNDGVVSNVKFTGGCDGNLKAISKLIDGKDAREVIGILKGTDCRGRGTSCSDQLTKGLEEALAKEA